MYRYTGQLIHESHDDDGLIEVVEHQGLRSLHFGSAARQSSMSLKQPDELQLAYVRAMMSWLLFKDKPDNALLIGLGAGSSAKYLLRQFDLTLTAVESRASVVRIARSHFYLPLDKRLKVIIDDGNLFLRKQATQLAGYYQLLFLDAFDHEGLASSVQSGAFFAAGKQVLRADGMMIVNLWSSEKALFAHITQCLKRLFAGRILFLPVPNKGNIIVLALGEALTLGTLNQLQARAIELEQRYYLEFALFFKTLKRHNAETLQQLTK